MNEVPLIHVPHSFIVQTHYVYMIDTYTCTHSHSMHMRKGKFIKLHLLCILNHLEDTVFQILSAVSKSLKQVPLSSDLVY